MHSLSCHFVVSSIHSFRMLCLTIMTRYIFSSLFCVFRRQFFFYSAYYYSSHLHLPILQELHSLFFLFIVSITPSLFYSLRLCERLLVLNCVRVAGVFLFTAGKTLCITGEKKNCVPFFAPHFASKLMCIFTSSLCHPGSTRFLYFFFPPPLELLVCICVFTMCSFLFKFIIFSQNKGKFT